MRSASPHVVEINKVRGQGDLPGFLPLIHRHFQKSKPFVGNPKEAYLTASLDLLDMIVPEQILKDIESIEIQYKRTT